MKILYVKWKAFITKEEIQQILANNLSPPELGGHVECVQDADTGCWQKEKLSNANQQL